MNIGNNRVAKENFDRLFYVEHLKGGQRIKIKSDYFSSDEVRMLQPHFQCTTELDFGFVDLRDMPSGTLQKFSQLSGLEIWECQYSPELLSEISQLRDLWQLDMRGNSLRPEDLKFLRNLKRLNRLELAENWLNALNPEDFKALENLAELDLSRNQLHGEHLQLISQHEKLRELDLSNNPLVSIDPEIFQGCDRLRELNLCGTGLTMKNISEIARFVPSCHIKTEFGEVTGRWNSHQIKQLLANRTVFIKCGVGDSAKAFTSQAAKQAVLDYENQIRNLEQEYQQAINDAKASYFGRLDSLIQGTNDVVDVDEAQRICDYLSNKSKAFGD